MEFYCPINLDYNHVSFRSCTTRRYKQFAIIVYSNHGSILYTSHDYGIRMRYILFVVLSKAFTSLQIWIYYIVYTDIQLMLRHLVRSIEFFAFCDESLFILFEILNFPWNSNCSREAKAMYLAIWVNVLKSKILIEIWSIDLTWAFGEI